MASGEPGGGGSLGGWFASEGLDFITSLFTGDWTGFIQRMLDPFDLWFSSVFSGRPTVGKDSASDDTALFFIPSANPVVALWGVGIRGLEGMGIPTSASGGAGYAANLALASAVAADLAKQFDGPNAGKVLFHGVPVTGAQVFGWYHLLGFQANHPDSNPTAIQERIQLDKLYLDLVTTGGIDPGTGFPPAGGGGIVCPPGQHWDGTKCVPDTVTNPGNCPPGSHWDGTKCVPDINPAGSPEQDELQDCCDETQIALTALLNAVTALGSAGGGAGASTCCTEVVSALSTLAQQLASIALAVGNIAGGGVDLTSVTAALNSIAAAVASIGGGGAVNVNILNPTPLVTATATAPATDITPIVDQLAALVREGDVKQGVLDYLTAQGFLTGADAQVIHGADWADAIVGTFRTYGWNALIWILGLVGITWDGRKLNVSVASFERAIAADFAGAVSKALATGAAPLYPEIKGIIDGVAFQLEPAQFPSLGDSGVDGDLLIAKTLAPVLIINMVSWLFSYLGWEISEQLKEYVDLASELTGLAEVKEIKLGQAMQHGPIAAARLQAQRIYRQSLPGAGAVTGWQARGLMSLGTAQRLLALGGFEDALQPAQIAGAYTGINPRQLLRLIPTGLFSDADLVDEMTFAGMRPVSQNRIILAAPYIATEPYRSKLRNQLEAQHEAGLMSDAELVSAIDSADHNFSRDLLILDTVHAKEMVDIAKALEAEYSALYRGGLIDHTSYLANLTGMGLQQWKADALIGIEDAKRAATLARQLAAAEKQLARATAATERQAAMAAFSTGTIDSVALAAALALTGLTPQQVAAWTSLATLRRMGNLRWVYGLQLNPDQATVLKERIGALTAQREKTLISDAEYLAALTALNIPGRWINSLRATADAKISPRKSAFAWPVEIN